MLNVCRMLPPVSSLLLFLGSVLCSVVRNASIVDMAVTIIGAKPQSPSAPRPETQSTAILKIEYNVLQRIENHMWITAPSSNDLFHTNSYAIFSIITSVIALLIFAVIQSAGLHRKSADGAFRVYIRFCYFTGLAIISVWPSSLIIGDSFKVLGFLVAWWSCILFWFLSLQAFSFAPIRYTWLPLLFTIGIYWSPFLGGWLFQFDDTFHEIVGIRSLFFFGCIFLGCTYFTDKAIPQADPELLGCGKPEHREPNNSESNNS
jgi:hypothetical protein